MRKFLIGFLAVVLVVFGGRERVGAVSEEVTGAVSVNCARILVQLKNVRYYDRRAREYLGNRYERILSGLVTNLNVRLVKNNISNVRMQTAQVALAAAHGEFKVDYGRYAGLMDGLIDMDCVGKPEEFYKQLGVVRQRREVVHRDVENLGEWLAEYGAAVEELRGLL